MITFTARGRGAKAETNEPITSGSVGLPVIFCFDSVWNDLTKQVSYRANNITYARAIINDADVVPWECLVKPGVDLWIGVTGKNADGSVVIPTVWARVDRVKLGATPDGAAPGSPTPSWADQIQQTVDELREQITSFGSDIATLITQEGTHTHEQMIASGVWTYTHNLGKYPSVTVVDSAGSIVYGDVQYLDENTVEVTFSAPFSGTMYLN